MQAQASKPVIRKFSAVARESQTVKIVCST